MNGPGIEGTRPKRAGTHALAAFAVLTAIALTACRQAGPPDRETPLSPMQFVEIVVELRQAEREALAADSAAAAFEQRKTEILARHGATEEMLREFARVRSGDLRLMSAVWDSITQRLKYVPPRHDPTLEQQPRERASPQSD